MNVSNTARDFILKVRGTSTEPFTNVVDRIIHNYQEKDIFKVAEERDRFKRISEHYYKNWMDCLSKMDKKLDDF